MKYPCEEKSYQNLVTLWNEFLLQQFSCSVFKTSMCVRFLRISMVWFNWNLQSIWSIAKKMSCAAFIPLKSNRIEKIEFHFLSTILSGNSNRNRLKIPLKIWISSQSSQVEKYLTTYKIIKIYILPLSKIIIYAAILRSHRSVFCRLKLDKNYILCRVSVELDKNYIIM